MGFSSCALRGQTDYVKALWCGMFSAGVIIMTSGFCATTTRYLQVKIPAYTTKFAVAAFVWLVAKQTANQKPRQQSHVS